MTSVQAHQLEAQRVADLLGRAHQHDRDAVLARRPAGHPRRSRRAPCRRPWRRRRRAAWPASRVWDARPGGSSQSTSTAWRPLYQPQLGQTTCGVLAAWQCGHTLRAGRRRRHAAGLVAAALGLGLLLLRDSHGRSPTIGSGARVHSRRLDGRTAGTGYRSTSRLAHRGSRGATQPQSPSLRLAPHWGHRPAQSSRHRGAIGSSSTTASRTSGPRSMVVVDDRVELLVRRPRQRGVGEALAHGDAQLPRHRLGAAPADPDPGGGTVPSTSIAALEGHAGSRRTRPRRRGAPRCAPGRCRPRRAARPEPPRPGAPRARCCPGERRSRGHVDDEGVGAPLTTGPGRRSRPPPSRLPRRRSRPPPAGRPAWPGRPAPSG